MLEINTLFLFHAQEGIFSFFLFVLLRHWILLQTNKKVIKGVNSKDDYIPKSKRTKKESINFGIQYNLSSLNWYLTCSFLIGPQNGNNINAT